MISRNWSTSQRKYGVLSERDVKIPVSDGISIDCDIFRPDARGKFPAILSIYSASKQLQSAPLIPSGFNLANAPLEAGDPNFYVRRGYVHVITSSRGSGKSEGTYLNYGPREVQDTYEAIDWIANQPWCDGNVGMFGVSGFSITQQQVSALNPSHLKCIFAPFGYTDFYRDKYYHGGILAHAFMKQWASVREYSNSRCSSWSREKMGEAKYREAISQALQDEDICAVPYLVEALKNPDRMANPILVDIMINPLDGPYYQERNVKYENDIKVPSYLGGGWGMYGLHLPGAPRSWENIRNAPKKMTIGPPIYLDRPVYQYAYESLRWFDYWMKGIETGIMEEPPIRLFVMGSNEWKAADDWPLPETKWTPFYLHANGLLSEHEFWPGDGADTFEDSLYQHGSLKFFSPPMVENTEIIGPISLSLFASTTDNEVLWFVSLSSLDSQDNERLLTRGWLRGSQREVDPVLSKEWKPVHSHTRREPLNANDVYEFKVEIMPTAVFLKAGERIGLKISCVDNEKPTNALEQIGSGHLWRYRNASRVIVYHDADHPSHLLLPITRGNLIGTFISGGHLTIA